MASFSISGNKILCNLHDGAVLKLKEKDKGLLKTPDAKTFIINTAVNPGDEFVLGGNGTFQVRVQAAMFESEDKAKEFIAKYFTYFCDDADIKVENIKDSFRAVDGDKSGKMYVVDVDFKLAESGSWKPQSFEPVSQDDNGTEKVKESRNYTPQELVKEILVGNKENAKVALEKIISRKIKNKIKSTLEKNENEDSK